MDGSAVKEIARLSDENKTLEIGGQLFARGNYSRVYDDPRPNRLGVQTLSAFIDYIKKNPEGVPLLNCVALVSSPESVSLVESFSGESKARTVFIEAALDESLPEFPFGRFMPVEEFIIKTRSLFEYSDDLPEVLTLVSKVVAQNEVISRDDGISQEVQVRRGVSGAASEPGTTKGIYTLRAYRTFRDIEQPKGSFILRLAVKNGETSAALFDAEGGSWRYEATVAIRAHLVAALGDAVPVLA